MGAARRSSAWIALLFTGAATTPAAIHFDDFTSPQGLSFVGDAAASANLLRITRAKGNRSGAVWFREKQAIASGFETTFRFQLKHPGGLGHGADGFAFVLQNAGPDALGGRGSAGGFAVTDPSYHDQDAAIPWSFAIFFDTYRNGNEKDPSANYVAFCTYGKPDDMPWPAARLAFTPKLSVRLKDRRVHTARILFQPPVLSVFLDDAVAPVLKSIVDLSIVLDSQGSAWAGFTASTGGGYENHDILDWSFLSTDVSSSMSAVSSHITFLMSACLPGHNLCTPESPVSERSGTGYHVILPGNLEWGVSIPEPPGKTVTITNAHGIVCWDRAERDPDGCSGPAGKGALAGSAFLAADAPPGALIMRRDNGHILFSANGRRDSSFHNNQGFYEFNLEIH